MNEIKDDQAELLRKQMEEINQSQPLEEETDSFLDKGDDGIDVLNLPPRSVVHDDQNVKFKWKFNSPIVRLIVIIILIVVILILTYNYWGDYFFS